MPIKIVKKSYKNLPKEIPFPHKNLISVKDLTKEQTYYLFDLASYYLKIIENKKSKHPKILSNLILINLFFETSTRTRISFEIAAKKLGMDVVNFSPSDSSLMKGETVWDTINALNSMQPDLYVLRTKEEDLFKVITKAVKMPVINAGNGKIEHPTQALLDAFTIYREFQLEKTKSFKDLTFTICGDIKHSRVARSNLLLLKKLGANLLVCSSNDYIPEYVTDLGVLLVSDLDTALKLSDVIMMLRYQKERMNWHEKAKINIGPKLWIHKYQINEKKLKSAKKNLKIMHPGPVNYGYEITEEVASGRNSLIQKQISNGVAMRMALLDVLTRAIREKIK